MSHWVVLVLVIAALVNLALVLGVARARTRRRRSAERHSPQAGQLDPKWLTAPRRI